MDQEHLHRVLEELHTELRATKPVDPGTRDLLQHLAQDIGRVLDKKPLPATPEHYRGMRPRLQDAVRAFEASHPELSKTIENVMETLALYNL